MDNLTALRQEVAKLQRRAARWKHAAKENREKFLDLCDNVDDIVDEILNALDPDQVQALIQGHTVH